MAKEPDKCVDQLHERWKASIVFPLVEMLVRDIYESSAKAVLAASTPVDRDICDYLNGQKACRVARLYFDPEEYPPPLPGEKIVTQVARATSEDGPVCHSWNDLFADLGRRAMRDGTILNANGGASDRRCLICTHQSRSRNKYCRIVPTPDNPLRVTTQTNDHKNTRHIGKGAPGAPRRVKPKERTGPCHFRFFVCWDDVGYYVPLDRKAGNPWHERHPRPIDPGSAPVPRRFRREGGEEGPPRDRIDRQIEEARAAADALGREGRQRLSLSLREVRAWCHQQQSKRAVTDENEERSPTGVERDEEKATPSNEQSKRARTDENEERSSTGAKRAEEKATQSSEGS